MRRPLFALASLFTLLVVAFGALTVVSFMAKEERRSDVSFEAGVRTIRIDGDAGRVRLVGGDVEQVTGTRTVVRGLQGPSYRETVQDGVLVLHAECPALLSVWCAVDYDLVVPRSARLDIDNDGGDIVVQGLDGDLALHSSGGAITVGEATGRVTASSSGGGVTISGATGVIEVDSSGGDVRVLDSRSAQVVATSSGGGVRLEFATPPDRVLAESSGGAVRVLLPQSSAPGGGARLAYAVDASSSGGGVTVDVPTDSASAHRIEVSSSGGGVSVGYLDPPRVLPE